MRHSSISTAFALLSSIGCTTIEVAVSPTYGEYIRFTYRGMNFRLYTLPDVRRFISRHKSGTIVR